MTRTLTEIQSRCIEEGECWLWQGAISGSCNGVGTPCMASTTPGERKTLPVRRVVWALRHGKPMPADLVASPRCGNRACVSPICAAALTRKEALQLAAKQGAFNNANKILKTAMVMRARSHITEEMVKAIRAADSGKRAHELTGVSWSYCKVIRRGDGRRDLSSPFAGL